MRTLEEVNADRLVLAEEISKLFADLEADKYSGHVGGFLLLGAILSDRPDLNLRLKALHEELKAMGKCDCPKCTGKKSINQEMAEYLRGKPQKEGKP